MSDWTVHLELVEGTSSKFWRARVEGKTLYVNYGKIGSNGQTQVKDLGDPAAARAEYEKLIREKRKKGYVDAGAAGTGDADGDADEREDEIEDEIDDEAAGEDEPDDEPDDEDAERPARARTSKLAAAGPATRTGAGTAPAGKPAAAAASKPAAASAAPAAGASGHRLVLDAGGRKAETTLYLDGKTVRMDSRETYASPDAAKKAFDRLKRLLGGEGYKEV